MPQVIFFKNEGSPQRTFASDDYIFDPSFDESHHIIRKEDEDDINEILKVMNLNEIKKDERDKSKGK